jgi:hypothetical protein
MLRRARTHNYLSKKVPMSWKEDLNYGLAAFGVQIPASVPLDNLVSRLTNSPARNTAAIVAASAAIFYAAEKHHNPKVNDIWDAAIYCSTCLSVGYGDIFAKTPIGKILGTTLMTIGPALSGAALDGVSAQKQDAIQAEVLTTLRAILAKM